jgi:hypothetical protein
VREFVGLGGEDVLDEGGDVCRSEVAKPDYSSVDVWRGGRMETYQSP